MATVQTHHETVEELRARLDYEVAVKNGWMTPEEIVELAAEERRKWVDENGVLIPKVMDRRKRQEKGRRRRPVKLLLDDPMDDDFDDDPEDDWDEEDWQDEGEEEDDEEDDFDEDDDDD